VSINQLQ